VLFLGGNEVQEHYRPRLDAEFAESYGGAVEVDWVFPGWSSNWIKVADRIEASWSSRPPATMVLMTFVRTNLGQWARRTAGEHGIPWVSCTGHGRAAIARSVDRAVRVALDRSSPAA
jgi:hypothetical protein